MLLQLDELEETNGDGKIDQKVDVRVSTILAPGCGAEDPKPLNLVLLSQGSQTFPVELDHALNLSPHSPQGQLNRSGHAA